MTENSLQGRTAVVTGASSGIGRACALALGRAGARVVVNYHGSAEAAEAVADEISRSGAEARAVQADISDESDVKRLFAETEEAFGPLDLLISNAGIQSDADLIKMSVEDWDKVISTNLRGAFLCARAAARIFCARERAPGDGPAGNVIFMSSVHERIPWSGHANYAASKGGIEMLMKSCAQELGSMGIRVNAIAPGAIKTEINRQEWENEATRADMLRKIPYGRIGDPQDIARAALWLASDDSDYVHGHTLVVDGGMTLYPIFMSG